MKTKQFSVHVGSALIKLLTILLGVCFFSASFAKDSSEDIDYLALAALMIKDGHYDRADAVLEEVDPSQKGLDLARFHTLKGLVLLHRGEFTNSRTHFETAIASGQIDPIIHIYLAQACFGAHDYTAALSTLDDAGENAFAVPDLYMLRAQSYWELKQYSSAWQTISTGLSRFADDSRLLRTRIFYRVELNLYHEALTYGVEFLSHSESTDRDFLAIAESLIKSGRASDAIEMLESARLRYPQSFEISIMLAHAYHSAGLPLASANLFAHVAATKPEFAFEAAELFRNAGQLQLALYWNAQIEDQQKKIRQRLGILLQMENFEMAAALETRLSRLGLLDDEDIRYALAYALYKIHDFNRAEKHLKHLTRSDLFANANSLRLAIESCQAQTWECY